MAKKRVRRGVRSVLSYVLAAVLFLCGTAAVIGISLRVYYPLKYEEHILKYSEEYDIDPNLVAAVIHTESRFDPNSISSGGAHGLMQITPDTLEWIAEKNEGAAAATEDVLYDPEQNIKYGCMILSRHISEFNSEKTALAAYNAGRSRIIDWLSDETISADGIALDDIPYPETRSYVNKIFHAQKIYRFLYHLGG